MGLSPTTQQEAETVMTATNLTPMIYEARIVIESDPDPDISYLEQDEFADRLEEYRADSFTFVGVYAEARVRFATEQGGWTQGAYVRTPGIWGVESDSDASYFAELGKEEADELRDMLRSLGLSDDAIDAALLDVEVTYA